MTTYVLGTAAQTAINQALLDGPGVNNANYVGAYNAIYADLVAHGDIDPGVLYWFSQAAGINGLQFSSSPTAAGEYIWAYTQAAGGRAP
jgi:hypothetical protein